MDDSIDWKDAKTAEDFSSLDNESENTEEEADQFELKDSFGTAEKPQVGAATYGNDTQEEPISKKFSFKQINLSLRRNITALSDPSQHKPKPDYDSGRQTFDNWLDNSLVATSPNADLILFSDPQGHTFVAKLKLEPIDQYVFRPLDLALDHNEQVTSILCLPIMSTKKTSYGLVDWSVLAFGFSSGYVKFYTEQSICLLSLKFSDEPVVSLKCQTQKINTNARSECHFPTLIDEVLILYKSQAVLLDAIGLYINMKLAKEEILRNGSHYEPAYSLNTLPSILNCQRWKIQDQCVSDADLLGIRLTSSFDALKAESINQESTSPKALARTIAFAGQNPFLSLYKESFDSTSHSYTEVIGSLISIWNKPSPSRVKINEVNKTSYSPLYDSDRRATSVIASPDKRLAAVADDFGRVLLIDVVNWLVIRVWKGYRSAQYGWVEVKKDSDKRSGPRASFLVIYAPKRGLLEVWSVQRGPRIAAFNVGKGCRLLYCGHRMLNQQANTDSHSANNSQIPIEQPYSSHCYLLNAKSETLFAIELPYTYSLYKFGDLKSRDHLLINELATAVEQNRCAESCSEIIHRISLAESLQVAIQKVVFGLQPEKVVPIMENLIIKIVKNYDNHSGEIMTEDDEMIIELSKRILRLSGLFNDLAARNTFNLKLPDVNRHLIDQYDEHPAEVDKFADELGWSAPEILRYLSLLSLERSFMERHDSNPWPNLGEPLNWAEFISCFDLKARAPFKEGSTPKNLGGKTEGKISMIALAKFDSQFLCSDKVIKTAMFMYSRLSGIYSNCSFPTSKPENLSSIQKITNSYNDIEASSRLALLLQFWLSTKLCNHWKMWAFLQSQVAKISDELKVIAIGANDDTLLVQTWKRLCELILESDNIFAAIIATATLKTETMRTISDREKSEKLELDGQDSNELEDEHCALSSNLDWEHLCIDAERMSIVSQQLEDIYLLNLLLRYSYQEGHLVDSFLYRIVRLSAANIFRSGPTIVSELVAEWAVQSGIDLKILTKLYGKQDEFEDKIHIISCRSESIFKSRPESHENRDEHAKELLHHARTAYPLSLRPHILLIHCVWEQCRRWSNGNSGPRLKNDDRLLQNTLDCLNLIESDFLRHKLATSVYKTFFQLKFERLVTLVETNPIIVNVKSSRLRDQLSRKELAMAEDCLDEFVQFCCNLSELMMRTLRDTSSLSEEETEETKRSLLSIDNWWSTPTTVEILHSCTMWGAEAVGNDLATSSTSSDNQRALDGSTCLSICDYAASSIIAKTLQSSNQLEAEVLIELNSLANLMSLIFRLKIMKAYPLSLIGEESRRILQLDSSSIHSETDNELGTGKVTSLHHNPLSSLQELRRKFVRKCILSLVCSLDEVSNQFSEDEYSQAVDLNEKVSNRGNQTGQREQRKPVDHFVQSYRKKVSTETGDKNRDSSRNLAGGNISDADDDEDHVDGDESGDSLILFESLLSLASEWQLDCDEIHMEFVFELYRCNHDKIGAQLSVRVLDQQTLAAGLLKVATQRTLLLFGLSVQLNPSNVTAVSGNLDPRNERWSSVQPNLVSWLKSVQQEEMRRDIPPLSFANIFREGKCPSDAHTSMGLQIFVLHILLLRTQLLLDTIIEHLDGHQQQRYARDLLQLLESGACKRFWSASLDNS